LRFVFSQTRNFTVIAFTDANMYATSMAQRKRYKRRFRIEGSDSLHLPVLSLLCAWAWHLKTRTAHSRGQAICTSVRLCTSENETRTQNACASVPIRIVSYSYTMIVACTVRCSYKCSL